MPTSNRSPSPLPKAFEIDQRHLGNICDRSELASDQCAGRQAIGEATTNTPLLEAPLKGPVYAVSGYGILPHLAFILDGQVMLTPEAESSTLGHTGRLKTLVPVVPDAPIGNFRFTLFGGSQGYLSNTQSLCSAPTVSTVEFTGQNEKTLTQQVKTKTACKARKTKKSPSVTNGTPSIEFVPGNYLRVAHERRDAYRWQPESPASSPNPHDPDNRIAGVGGLFGWTEWEAQIIGEIEDGANYYVEVDDHQRVDVVVAEGGRRPQVPDHRSQS